MDLVCPYCNASRSTDKVINPGSKVRCPDCKNIFTPVPLEVDLDGDLPPPPRPSAPVFQHQNRPLHGRRFKPMEASRQFVAGLMGIVILGALAVFTNWYAHTVKILDVSAAKAGQKRGSKIQKLASGRATLISTPAAPKIPVVSQPIRITDPVKQSKPVYLQPTLAQAPSLPAPQPPPPPAPVMDDQTRPKKAVDADEEKKANSKLYMARKLEKEGKVRLANKLYLEILDKYPDTDAAKKARERADSVTDHRTDKAQEQLSHAQQLEKTNSFREATAEYEGIISRYPDTPQAKIARERLERLESRG